MRRVIWIVQIGEPVPHDSSHANDRLFRSGMLAKQLADDGEDVVWWASTVDHARKSKRFDSFREVEILPRLKVAFLDGCLYQRNISIKRWVNHIQVARQFKHLINKYRKPDAIVLNFPTPELCDVGVRFGLVADIPTVVDVRDLWPEDLVNLLPPVMRFAGRVFTLPMHAMAKRVFRGASHFTGVTSGYLQHALMLGSRRDGGNHRVFHLAYANPNSDEVIDKIINESIPGDFTEPIRFVFSGMLGVSVEMRPVFEAIRLLFSRGHSVVFDICGKGDKYEGYYREFGSRQGFEFHGFVDHACLDKLLRRAHFGVMPYINRGSLRRNIPNKVGEYLSYGLPILSTLPGSSACLIEDDSVGMFHESADEESPVKLADFVADALAKVDAWRELRRRCRRVFLEKFDARKVYSDYAGWVAEVAENRLEPPAPRLA